MELRHLRYFVATGEALSFTRAAQKLHLTQPALTRQIKDLEAELGVRLLERNKQRVRLTPEGSFFFTDAKRVLALSNEIVESVQRRNRQANTVLNLGYVANIFYDRLPPTLAAFQCAYPRVSVNLFDMNCASQFRALREGRLDLGFVGQREAVEEAGLQYRCVANYRVLAALPKKMILLKKPAVRLKELAAMFFIAMSEASYPGYRRWLDATCRRAGFAPRVLQDVDAERTMVQSVAEGLGVALLPTTLQRLPHHCVAFRPLSPAVIMESCVAWKSDNASPALRAYLEIVCALDDEK